MNQNTKTQHSPAWVFFTYLSFAVAIGMTTIGIFVLPIDLWGRAFLSMGLLMTVQSCITMTKTQRDMHEGTRMVNRIEDARTEKLLMDAGH